jgi:hypothetical protein
MSLFYLYRFKFAVKLQIIMFENAIIGHFATRAVSVQFWPCCEKEGLGLGWLYAWYPTIQHDIASYTG